MENLSLTVHMTTQFVGLCNCESQAPIRHALLSSDNACLCLDRVFAYFNNFNIMVIKL